MSQSANGIPKGTVVIIRVGVVVRVAADTEATKAATIRVRASKVEAASGRCCMIGVSSGEKQR